jgi:hypothetical protein
MKIVILGIGGCFPSDDEESVSPLVEFSGRLVVSSNIEKFDLGFGLPAILL